MPATTTTAISFLILDGVVSFLAFMKCFPFLDAASLVGDWQYFR